MQSTGPRSFGNVLDTGMTLFFKAFTSVALILAIVNIPVLILSMVSVHTTQGVLQGIVSNPVPSPQALSSFASSVTGLGFLTQLLALFGYATVLVALDMRYRGGEPNVGEAFRKGGRRFLMLFLLTIVVYAAVGVAFILLVIPGIIVLVYFSQTSFLAVLDDEGFSALGRSWRLVSGHWWRIFGIAVVSFLIYYAALAVVTAVAGTLLAAIGMGTGTAVNPYALAIVGTVVQTLIGAFPVAALYVQYMDLRLRKEGIDLTGPGPETVGI